jgi:short-subunit dehydrogenase
VLVNNAGFGSGGAFQDLDVDNEVRMVKTNCEAVVALTGHYVRGMVERGRGAILTTASVAAFQPLPRQATYSASKAFALTFSEALSADLAGTGVSVTALCPGPVHTEFGQEAGIEEELFSMASVANKQPEEVAEAAVKGMEGGKRVVVPGIANQVSTFAGQHTPRSVLLAVMRRFYPVGK